MDGDSGIRRVGRRPVGHYVKPAKLAGKWMFIPLTWGMCFAISWSDPYMFRTSPKLGPRLQQKTCSMVLEYLRTFATINHPNVDKYTSTMVRICAISLVVMGTLLVAPVFSPSGKVDSHSSFHRSLRSPLDNSWSLIITWKQITFFNGYTNWKWPCSVANC